jgi:hypothetical protein
LPVVVGLEVIGEVVEVLVVIGLLPELQAAVQVQNLNFL